MYRDTRPTADHAITASPPESWAAAFAHATRMNRWKAFRLASSKAWHLIRRSIPRVIEHAEEGPAAARDRIVYRLANFAVVLLFSWMEAYRVMRYCVASKVKP